MILLIIGMCSGVMLSYAQTHIYISDTETWRNTELNQYIGQRVMFDCPMYVTSNARGSYSVSPRRLYSPTNQALPLSDEYRSVVSLNNYGAVSISGMPGYHRCGEIIDNLTVTVQSSNHLRYESGAFIWNTRADMEKGIPALNQNGEPRLVVCAMNLEYYLVEQFGSLGPASASEHQKQRAKVSAATKKIAADVFGFVEVQQGSKALAEIADDLSRNTGYAYEYIDDGGSASGTYTKSGYVYRSDKVEPIYQMYHNNTIVQNRKKIQAFKETETGEVFLFSLNHFKAKSGSGSGLDADQGDGQGIFNYSRTQEAQSVLTQYMRVASETQEKDILIMGDLNAYAKEDPITTLTSKGMLDLHRMFHADTSYSYVFGGKAGYLDHALCNTTLYPQITGMAAYHINSDESDEYTYDKSNDRTMFRCSDHDPVLIGLALDGTLEYNPELSISREGNVLIISNAHPELYKSFYAVYTIQGLLLQRAEINSNEFEIPVPNTQGVYIIQIYHEGKVSTKKISI